MPNKFSVSHAIYDVPSKHGGPLSRTIIWTVKRDLQCCGSATQLVMNCVIKQESCIIARSRPEKVVEQTICLFLGLFCDTVHSLTDYACVKNCRSLNLYIWELAAILHLIVNLEYCGLSESYVFYIPQGFLILTYFMWLIILFYVSYYSINNFVFFVLFYIQIVESLKRILKKKNYSINSFVFSCFILYSNCRESKENFEKIKHILKLI